MVFDVAAHSTRRPPVTVTDVRIPCHRIVGDEGGLSGYAGGLRRKQSLLDLERVTSTVLAGRF